MSGKDSHQKHQPLNSNQPKSSSVSLQYLSYTPVNNTTKWASTSAAENKRILQPAEKVTSASTPQKNLKQPDFKTKTINNKKSSSNEADSYGSLFF